MSLSDQIADLEADHTAALAKIDELQSTLDALRASHAALATENAALAAQADQLIRFTADVRAMAENTATATLDMLRASRREIYTKATIVPASTPKPDATDIPVAAEVIPAPPEDVVDNLSEFGGIDRSPSPHWFNRLYAGEAAPAIGASA